jgi:hypothetical protein
MLGQGDLDLVKKLPGPGRDLGGMVFHRGEVDRLPPILETYRCSSLHFDDHRPDQGSEAVARPGEYAVRPRRPGGGSEW